MPHYFIPAGAELPALAAQIVAEAKAANAKVRTGDCWSAMGPLVPEVPTYEAVLAQLERQAADSAAFQASPRGCFLAALRELKDDHFDEWHRLMGFYDRSLADDREPLNVAAVGECIRILAGMECMAAQDAELALADLLVAEAAQMQAAA